jgi:Ca2+-binding EF-hand superfamily protein
MPPEVWQNGLWTAKGDIFSMGSLFFSLVARRTPFDGRTMDEFAQDTLRCNPDLSPLSGMPKFRRLVASMLHPAYQQRPNTTQVQKGLEDWGRSSTAQPAEVFEIAPEAAEELATFREKSKLYEALLQDMAANVNLSGPELKAINDQFILIDEDGDGMLTASEVRAALVKKLEPQKVDNLVQSLVGDDGRMSYTSFMAAMMGHRAEKDDELFWELFRKMDTDKNGSLDINEVRKMMKAETVQKAFGECITAEDVFRRMDENGDGQVDFWEFRTALEMRPFKVGEKVLYCSGQEWIPTEISAVDRTGACQVAAKPDYWIQSPAEQRQLIRNKRA